MPRTVTTAKRATLLARAQRGEWLLPQEVADILGVHRATVVRMLDQGNLTYRNRPGNASKPYREADPKQVLAMYRRRTKVHQVTEPTRDTPSTSVA